MKVQLKNIDPNPFRDMEHYPIRQDKVEGIKRSIIKTGYWDNIVGRVSPKNKSRIELAYGHHRWYALKEIFKPLDGIEIIIKALSDDDMLRIMLLENDEDYDSNPIAFNEGILKLWERLKEQSPLAEIVKGRHINVLTFGNLPISEKDSKRSMISWQMANWIATGYSEAKVYTALETLKETGQIEIDARGTKREIVSKEAVEKMPFKSAASRFVNIAKKANLSHSQQKRIANKLSDIGDFSDRGIRAAIIDEKQGDNYRDKKGKDIKLFELGEEIKETTTLISKLNSKIITLIRFREEISSTVYQNEIHKLGASVVLLVKNLKNLTIGGDNGRLLEE